jgi:hypothetical protein
MTETAPTVTPELPPAYDTLPKLNTNKAGELGEQLAKKGADLVNSIITHKGLVIIVILIALLVSAGYLLSCYTTNKYSQYRRNNPSSSILGTLGITNKYSVPNGPNGANVTGDPSSSSSSLLNKFSSFRHRPTITVIIPAALNGADYAAVDKQQHIFVYRHGESLPGVLTELNPQSTPLVLLVINTGAVGAVPYGFLVPSANGIPISALDGSSLNNISCNYSHACGSLSLQGVFTNEQLRIIGSYSGALPTYNNGNTLNPNTSQSHRTRSHWH